MLVPDPDLRPDPTGLLPKKVVLNACSQAITTWMQNCADGTEETATATMAACSIKLDGSEGHRAGPTFIGVGTAVSAGDGKMSAAPILLKLLSYADIVLQGAFNGLIS